jgi:hypothetical protein
METFSLYLAAAQGIDDAPIRPMEAYESRQSLEISSRLSLAKAQPAYSQMIGRFPVQ